MRDGATNGRTAGDVSNRAGGLLRQYSRRGPTETRTTIDRDHGGGIMRDGLTASERTLCEHGYDPLVLDSRRAMQEILRPELAAFIEQRFGRPCDRLHERQPARA